MTDELMSLEQLDAAENDFIELLGYTEFSDGHKANEIYGFRELLKTARAAHEWKAKYDARVVEESQLSQRKG